MPDIDLTDLRTCLNDVLTQVPEDSSTDLWAEGIMDSFTTVEVVIALEARYGVQFDPDTLRQENFKSLNSIAQTLTRMQRAA